MSIKKFREFLSEEWLVVDKEKNCVISKHGDDEKGATIAGRKMDFQNWNKTHKLGRFGILATHGPAMATDKPDQFAKPGEKKKTTAKAKKATSKAKPTAKKASTKKPTGSKVKTSGQNAKGGLSTQIGGLIARHMAKMFKEETEINELSPGTLGNYINKAYNRSKVLSIVRDQSHGQASTAGSTIDREYSRKINNADIGVRRATDRLAGHFNPTKQSKSKTNFLGKSLGKPSNQGGPSKTIGPNPNPPSGVGYPKPQTQTTQTASPMSNLPHANIPTAGSPSWIKQHRVARARSYLLTRKARAGREALANRTASYKQNDPYIHAKDVLKKSKRDATIQKAYNIEHPPKEDEQYKKDRETVRNAKRSATTKAAWAINHPWKAAALGAGAYVGYKALGVAKKTLFNSVNDQIERLLFETEETPNYYVQVLLCKGGVGDKSFRRHNLDAVRPIYTGAPNEPFDTKWLNNIITNDEQINLYCDEGYKIEEIFGSDDSNLCEKEMNEKHAHMVRVNDAIRRKFLPTEEYENDRSQ